MKYSKMVAGYCPLPKLNKNCTKTVGVSESGEADRVWCWDLTDRWLPSSWHQTRGLLQPTLLNRCLLCWKHNDIPSLVLVWELHGMDVSRWFITKMVWYSMVVLAASRWFIAKMVPPSLTPILGHGHPLHPQVAPGIIETRGGLCTDRYKKHLGNIIFRYASISSTYPGQSITNWHFQISTLSVSLEFSLERW